MIGLPDPSACPVFQYYDQDTGTLQDVTYADGSQPRRIDDYILDPADWQPENHAHTGKHSSSSSSSSSPSTDTGPSSGINTRAAVLAYGVDKYESCRVCGRRGRRCLGDSCARTFCLRMEVVASSGKLQIEKAAVQGVALGYGVFVRCRIREGDIVGEYLGRLHPSDGPGRVEGGHEYVFELDGIATVDARDYGSITRFVNHRCKPNLDVQFITYGRRRCIFFAARRDIASGEQLFIHYGDDYFSERRPCRCDVVPFPHLPPLRSEQPWRVPISAKLLAARRKMQKQLSSSSDAADGESSSASP